jgi:hypothetical protein
VVAARRLAIARGVMAARRLGVFLNCKPVRLFRVLILSSVLVSCNAVRSFVVFDLGSVLVSCNAVRVFVLFGLSSVLVSRNDVRLFTMLMLSSVFAAMFAGGRRWVLMIARAEGFSPDLLD